MAEKVIKNAYVSMDGNEVGGYGTTVKITYSAESIDKTTFGTSGSPRTGKQRTVGLKDVGISIEFNQDLENLDSVLDALVGADPFTVIIKSEDAAVSASNPQHAGTAILPNYDGAGASGGVGELAKCSITLEQAEDDWVRTTS